MMIFRVLKGPWRRLQLVCDGCSWFVMIFRVLKGSWRRLQLVCDDIQSVKGSMEEAAVGL